MKIKETKIKIKDLFKNYKNDIDEGVQAYKGKLNVRPAYQRQFVYKPDKRNAVIDSVLNNYPLSIMYWSKTKEGDYECLDGQQRTISICDFIKIGGFSIKWNNNLVNYYSLDEIEKKQIDNYELTIYICEGSDEEKLKWFEKINISGEKLYPQELRNAIYTSEWLTDLKRYLNKRNCAGNAIFEDYHNKEYIRGDLLELVLKWLSKEKGISIEQYMLESGQQRKTAKKEWKFLNDLRDWIESIFDKKYSDMRKVEWGSLYFKFKNQNFNIKEINAEVEKLRKDDDVKNKAGIYPFIFERNPKHLNLRIFTKSDIISVLSQQDQKCNHCKKNILEKDARGDHIKPWSKGGKTIIDNLQVLCPNCNLRKYNKY